MDQYIILGLAYGVILFSVLSLIFYLRLRQLIHLATSANVAGSQAKEIDPKLAGQLRYREQLLLHGK